MRNPDRKFERLGIDFDSDPVVINNESNVTKKEDILINVVSFTLATSLVGIIIIPNAKSCEHLKIYKTSSLIVINNHEIHIYDNVPIEEVHTKNKYNIIELNNQNWLIYVYGANASQYSDFMASNIYFDENNKIVLDSFKLTDENFEYFINNENSNDNNSRVRKG
ncbi:MAG: hypothetical protein J5634_03685 [Bacilli bacterium]|nr:hypothetical protein [Bacilli bacterium]